MAFQVLSIGDIWVLSKQALKIGKAFTQGRGSAPYEFSEIEREANGLSEALRLTAETLHADGSILSGAEPETRGAVNEILKSAAKTLGDLESFVERYQVITKKETSGGWGVSRTWSEVMLATYKTIRWTTEGESITKVRDMLHMHTNTISVTMQALQSKSLSRLERTVRPMAENIASIHSLVNGDLGDKIDDIHQLIMSLASHSPLLVARNGSIEVVNGHNAARTATLSSLSRADERLGTGQDASGPRGDSYQFTTDQAILLPPVTPSSPAQQREESWTAATPSSFLDSRHRSESHVNGEYRICPQMNTPPTSDSPPSSSALATLATFEKSLFTNAAILCDVRGKLVEYAQKVPDAPDTRFDTEMVEVCQECRIRVIRKWENRAHGGTKLTTSIWAISADGAVKCQQKISDYVETVPYCSYFEREKISIPPTDEGEMIMRFYGEMWTDELEREVKTNWVNYVFVSEEDANTFQSAVFGRLLIGSFRTTKTTVIHDGLMGVFAFEEQFANIEMLRLWEDDGVATPGAQGGVLALMHVSSNFGEGWARWWINCSRSKLRVKDDPPKHARIKGIDLILEKPGTVLSVADRMRRSTTAELQRVDTGDTAARPKSCRKVERKRVISGVRIEFSSEKQREVFIEMTRQYQDRLIPLPKL